MVFNVYPTACNAWSGERGIKHARTPNRTIGALSATLQTEEHNDFR
jgi:hypothetical protein